MNHLALARKWRPRSFEELVGQKHAVTAFSNALKHQRLHHAYLLTGTRGVGKTTIARILAKCLNCEQGITATPCGTCEACQEIDKGRFIDLFEIDAASRTKVEDTRELLDNVQYAPSKGRYKVYLIDEVHMLSGHSFNALLKTLEEPPEHVKFILATTDPEKLPATVLSRCLQFHLLALLPDEIASHLNMICEQEQIPCDDTGLRLLARAANGSLRDALSLLDQAIAYGNQAIQADSVREMLGTIEPHHLADLTQALIDQSAEQLLDISQHLVRQGADFSQVLADFSHFLYQIAQHQACPQHTDSEQQAAISPLAEALSGAEIQLFYQIAIKSLDDLSLAPSAEVGFNMALLRMLAFYQTQPETPNNNQTQKPVSKNPLPTEKAKATTKSVSPTAPNTQAKASHTAKPSTSSDSWSEAVKALNLSGAARVLALNCELKQEDEKKVELQIDQQHQPLLQEKYRSKIADALTELTGKKRQVNITISTAPVDSPEQQNQQAQQKKQAAAVESVHKDHHIQQIVETFDAKIIESSILSNK